jgi:hypothetical protein
MIEFSSIKTLPSEHFIQAVVFFCRRNCFCKGRSDVRRPIGLLIGPILLVIVFYEPVLAQDPARIPKEVTAEITRYRKREAITGRYERHEVKPRTHLPFVAGRTPRGELITLAPTAERIRTRKYLANSHWGLKFYEWRTCIRCHPRQAQNLHTARAKITCRQCHGEEPIAGIQHYYSPMHPRRRYAFVCAKCHKGSSASFATYVVHEPSPISMDTRNSFPALFYVFWFMVAIAAGTFAAFLPHTIMWGLREFLPDSPLEGLRKRLAARREKGNEN